MNANPKFLAATAHVDEAAIQSLPNSRKLYVGELRVPMREITQSGLSPDWVISRIGTRSSPTYSLRELGSDWMAASSTCAVAARNLGLAFMALPSAALPASGSKGLSHPLRPEQDPREPAKVTQETVR